MFEAAELGLKVSKKEHKERVPELRQALLLAQEELRSADFPVIVLLAGVDGAGKSEVVHALNEWMDPRWMVTRAYDEPSQEEAERPPYWRFWRDLPPHGQIGVLLSAWYSQPLLLRAYGNGVAEFEESLDEIADFEKHLADDGALIVKFWLHLDKKSQEKRFKQLELDPLQAWRVTERDWKHWSIYEAFLDAGENVIGRTSTGDAPWHIVEGGCLRYASLTVGTHLLESIQRRLAERAARASLAAEAAPEQQVPPAPVLERPITVFSKLEMSHCLSKSTYRKQLAKFRGRLNQLQRNALEQGVSTVLVFEGWDAAGKGGVIRRINSAIDSRWLQVVPVAAPTEEERTHPHLWRFWRHLPRAGRLTIFDRSWYGRVLVERVEGFATESEWRRAYAEINRFERQLVDFGIVLVKFWMNITNEEQLARFQERERTPWKQWKLTDEDWRNRERWNEYEIAAHEMVEHTSVRRAPWHLVPANDKPYARVTVLRTLCEALEARVGPVEETTRLSAPAGAPKKRSKK